MTDIITLKDLGTDLQVTVTETDVAVDISASTAQEIILKKPDGSEITRTASFITTGADGQIHYTTVSGDIDQRGEWSYRAKITFSAGQVFHSIDPQTFDVV